MNNWGEFEFNEEYAGDDILKINDVTLPKQYIDFMKQHNGGEGDIGESWFVLYKLEELQQINDDFKVKECLPEHIIIGSNGGGEFYGIDKNGNYFNVPEFMDVDDVALLGNDINELPDKVNELWS